MNTVMTPYINWHLNNKGWKEFEKCFKSWQKWQNTRDINKENMGPGSVFSKKSSLQKYKNKQKMLDGQIKRQIFHGQWILKYL